MRFKQWTTLALVLSAPAALAQGLNYNASKSNTGNIVISNGSSCTSVDAQFNLQGNVSGSSSTTAACSVAAGEYFLASSASQTIAPVVTVVPQFVDGGSWQTTLGIVNGTPSAATASLSCFQETLAGDSSTIAWTPPFTENVSTQNITLAPGATVFLDTPGTAATLTEG